MNILYTLKLKHLVIIDVMCIATGFLLRVLAGTTLAGVWASDWLAGCCHWVSGAWGGLMPGKLRCGSGASTFFHNVRVRLTRSR